MKFCIGHETFHLIVGAKHVANAPPSGQPGPLMSIFRPLRLVTITEEEILWIDLPNKKSVLKE
jgi:hypothetical protein